MEELPSDMIEDCQDVYALLAKDTGLKIGEVGKCLRMLNLNPSESDVKELINSSNLSDKTYIDFEEFVKLFKGCKEKCKIDEDEVKALLKKLDKDDTGIVKTSELKEMLMSGEEPLSLFEAENLLNDFNQDGTIVITDFLDALLLKN